MKGDVMGRACSMPTFCLHLVIIYCIVLYLRTVQYGIQSCDSSVGIALGYELDNWGSRVQFLAGAGNFSLHCCVQNSSGTHPVSCPMGTRGSFHGG
jgi:hypothetical protein